MATHCPPWLLLTVPQGCKSNADCGGVYPCTYCNTITGVCIKQKSSVGNNIGCPSGLCSCTVAGECQSGLSSCDTKDGGFHSDPIITGFDGKE